jgi:hypothetical protein
MTVGSHSDTLRVGNISRLERASGGESSVKLRERLRIVVRKSDAVESRRIKIKIGRKLKDATVCDLRNLLEWASPRPTPRHEI